jgi:hypothetical protein
LTQAVSNPKRAMAIPAKRIGRCARAPGKFGLVGSEPDTKKRTTPTKNRNIVFQFNDEMNESCKNGVKLNKFNHFRQKKMEKRYRLSMAQNKFRNNPLR